MTFAGRCTISAMHTFQERLNALEHDMVEQGARVLHLCTLAVESYFDLDLTKASGIETLDTEIDRIDVEIEKRSVPLLGMGQTDEHSIRSVLTIVKCNNEYERIADCGGLFPEDLPHPAERPFGRKNNRPVGRKQMAHLRVHLWLANGVGSSF